MKSVLRSLLAVACLLGCAAAATAQSSPASKSGMQPKPRVVLPPGVKDGMALTKGRIMLTETGITNPLLADKKLVNGTIITPTGLVTTPNGISTQMGEGDMVSPTGRITTRATTVAADSILKIQQYDLIHPGKRERDAKAKAEKDKVKVEREAAKAKIAKQKADMLKEKAEKAAKAKKK